MNFYSSPSTEITRGFTEGIGGLAGIDDNVRERGPEEKCFQTLAEGRKVLSKRAVAPPGFCNRGGVRYGSIGGLEYEVPQKLTHLLQCVGNL